MEIFGGGVLYLSFVSYSKQLDRFLFVCLAFPDVLVLAPFDVS